MIALAVLLPILLGWGVLELAGVFDDGTNADGDDEPIVDDVNEINAYGQDNDILGTTGNDLIHTNAGDDTVNGGMGSDTIDGGIGNDYLNGGVGQDLIEGGFGKDTISGEAFGDMLGGGGQSDIITGGDGDDLVLGNNGNDTRDGNRDNDALYGGGGADLIAGGKGDDILDGSNPLDLVNSENGAPLDVSVEFMDALAGARADYVENPNITLDELLTSPRFDGVTPLKDAQLDGADTLYGGEGNDTLYVGGLDVAKGGMGNDLFIFDEVANGEAGTIVDFKVGDRVEIMVPEGAADPVVEVRVEGEDALLVADNIVVGTFTGAATVLTVDMVAFLK